MAIVKISNRADINDDQVLVGIDQVMGFTQAHALGLEDKIGGYGLAAVSDTHAQSGGCPGIATAPMVKPIAGCSIGTCS